MVKPSVCMIGLGRENHQCRLWFCINCARVKCLGVGL